MHPRLNVSATDQDKLTSELATRCSEACTRAAIAALVLTGIAFSLVAPLQKLTQLEALSQYTSQRIQLKRAVDEVLNDPLWRKLQSQVEALGEDAKFWPLSQIQQSCMELDNGESIQPAKTAWRSPRTAGVQMSSPAVVAPSGVRISVRVSRDFDWTLTAGPICRALNNLTNLDIQSRALKYSHDVASRIERWQVLVERCKNFTSLGVGKIAPRPGSLTKLTDSIGDVTLADLDMLATLEMEDVAFFDKEPKSFGIAMPWMSERIGVEAAVPLIGVSLCVVIFYFWLFARHAYRLGLSDAHGTLFAAANEDQKSRWLFVLMSLAPAASLIVLSCHVTTPAPIVGCVVIVFFLSISSAIACTTRVYEHRT